MLYYKEDWAEAQPRFAAWWEGEIVDRVALAVTAPRDAPLGETGDIPEPEDLFKFWTDSDYRIGQVERAFNRTAYLGEAFPVFEPTLGPGSLALYLGCQPTLERLTVWYNPIWADLASPPTLRYDPDNEWWQMTRQLVAECVRRGRGRFLTTHPNLIENMDTVASLRGTEALLLDLLEHPDAVHSALRQVNALYFRYYDELYDVIAPATPGGGCASGFRVWGPGRVAKVECDFSAMISPRAFDEFVAPYLAEQCDRLDYSVYHLDGPQATRHLDTLLAIPSLKAIQWSPGAAHERAGSPRWYELYRRILRGGKSVYIMKTEPHEVEPLVRELGPAGLFIGTSTSTEEDARKLIDEARSW